MEQQGFNRHLFLGRRLMDRVEIVSDSVMPLAIVDLDGGGRYQGMVIDVKNPQDVKIGAKVELVFRKILSDRGVDLYGYKFRLMEED